jgi:hypothetical protein
MGRPFSNLLNLSMGAPLQIRYIKSKAKGRKKMWGSNDDAYDNYQDFLDRKEKKWEHDLDLEDSLFSWDDDDDYDEEEETEDDDQL